MLVSCIHHAERRTGIWQQLLECVVGACSSPVAVFVRFVARARLCRCVALPFSTWVTRSSFFVPVLRQGAHGESRVRASSLWKLTRSTFPWSGTRAAWWWMGDLGIDRLRVGTETKEEKEGMRHCQRFLLHDASHAALGTSREASIRSSLRTRAGAPQSKPSRVKRAPAGGKMPCRR